MLSALHTFVIEAFFYYRILDCQIQDRNYLLLDLWAFGSSSRLGPVSCPPSIIVMTYIKNLVGNSWKMWSRNVSSNNYLPELLAHMVNSGCEGK